MSNRVWCHLAIWMSWAILCAGSFISLCRPHHRLPYVLSFRTTQSDPSTRGMGVPIRRGMARRAKSVDRCASHCCWGCMSLLLPGIMFQVFFGGLGCCRFYYGYIKTGVVQLMLFCAPGAALDGCRCTHIASAEAYVLQPTPLAVDSCSHFILRQLRFGDPQRLCMCRCLVELFRVSPVPCLPRPLPNMKCVRCVGVHRNLHLLR